MPDRTRIKICGIRDRDTALAAVDAGADALGFVFVPRTSRHIRPEQAWPIVSSLPPFVSTVGLFRDCPLEEFCDAEEACPTTLTQLHGEEPEDLVRRCGPGVVKAVRFNPATIAAELARWSAVEEVDAILIDAGAGGAGDRFDWSLLAPHTGTTSKPLVIAGGLDPTNVAECVRTLHPYAVDVSSGVERARGQKDTALIRAFCAAVRAADSSG